MADASTKQLQPKPSAQKMFQCSLCKRTYTRADHLSRHIRSHLQERHFQCHICSKAFGRLDLLKRHVLGHQTNGKPPRMSLNQGPRVSQACKGCGAAKLKCDDEKPCGRCRQRGITCDYGGREPSMADQPDSPQCEMPPSSPFYGSDDATAISIATGVVQSTDSVHSLCTSDSMTNDGCIFTSTPSPVVEMPPPPPPLPPQQVQSQSQQFMPHSMSGFLRGAMTPVPHTDVDDFSASPWMDTDNIGPRGLLDFTRDGVDFNDTDLTLLDQLCGGFTDVPIPGVSTMQSYSGVPAVPGVLGVPAIANLDPEGNSHHMDGVHIYMCKQVALGSEAFQRSVLGIWMPAGQDRIETELENFLVLSAEAGPGSPDTRLALERRCLREPLSRTARDRILAMVLRTCKPERAALIVQTFPPAGLLDDLLECFFLNHRKQPDTFLHLATFNPNEQQVELLASLVALGATRGTDVRPLHKLGFALQESVRTLVPGRCEEANTMTRELWLNQAFLCELEAGMWSGIKRKMEIAESHTQILQTMLRRAGRFQRLQRHEELLSDDDGDMLQRKWRAWVQRESLKRLVFHAFVFDAHVSMAMLTNPVVSFAELAIPLPETRALWMAENAEQWKALYLERPQRQPPTLLDLLQPPHPQSRLPDEADYDVGFSHLVTLHAIWGMIWQHQQLVSTAKWPSQSWDLKAQGVVTVAASISLRRQELLLALHQFRVSIYDSAEAGPPHPESGLVLELLHMYLHMNIGDAQLFAGKERLEDARRVFPALQHWALDGTGADARIAVWHAGQVLRAARGFPQRRLDGFYAISVYHASLALWVYGVIVRKASTNQRSVGPDTVPTSSSAESEPVYLDGTESPITQRFVTLGRGSPCISSSLTEAGWALLVDPEMIMATMADVLCKNFSTTTEATDLPPLVQNLVQLLRDLGEATTGINSV